MTNTTINCITTRAQYDSVKSRLNELIRNATNEGMLEPGADNEYIRQIAELAKMIAAYEETLDLLPLKIKNPLIQCIEHYSVVHHLKKKEVAELLDVNESVFSQILNGKRKISIDLAKKLYTKLHIDPKTILENA